MKRNLQLLQQVRDKILLESEQHDQGTWLVVSQDVVVDNIASVSCATAACVAGWACVLTGDRAVIGQGDIVLVGEHAGSYSVAKVITPEGEVAWIDKRAGKLLGLNIDEYEELFDSDNTREEVLDMLDELIAEAKEQENKGE